MYSRSLYSTSGAYTYQGGVKTIVWTDTLQTTFMILALIVTVWFITSTLGLSPGGLIDSISARGYSQVFNTDWHSPAFFIKQILTGAFITIAMTGLDQEMMQKNISCKSLPEAQKNMVVFSVTLVLVNLLFLILGACLYLYLTANHIAAPAKPDAMFPTIALQYLPPFVGLIFIIGLVSALFPSADGAMTALTSSFCIDVLGLDKQNKPEEAKTRIRKSVHLTVVFVFLICILIFKWINTGSVITLILRIAGYTYGPLVALYILGLYSNIKFKEALVPMVCISAPVITYIIDANSKQLFAGYKMGFETAFLNVAITLIGLWLIRDKTIYVPTSPD
jgi:Na+/proline symporter